ncbi:hypothetical protein O7635_33205 [Asanoa sp. WMMD1127]|uniref:hypothetical protein n=1 Tax=Asanoa sp. WMMD1127 TaxID=3016107 RepID=UPI0024175402|nr:hypothetical protein [Asanoa sp. WMMD1127]MDG4826734.1 hypothetical protein [Asanoa sp. WMMD1127]
MSMSCRLGWHRWATSDGRIVCPRCRGAAVAPRPIQVGVAAGLLVGIAVVSGLRAVAALSARPLVDEAAAGPLMRDTAGRAAVFDALDVTAYSTVAGFGLAAVLVPVLIGLRGPLSGARWTALGVLFVSLLGQVLFISTDLADGPMRLGVVPGWYPLTQQAFETVLLLASAAVVVLLFHGASREYFEEGVVNVDADDAMERALESIRRRRAAER